MLSGYLGYLGNAHTNTIFWGCSLDSIAVSVFVVVLVEFDKYRIWDEQACLIQYTNVWDWIE